MQFLLRHYEKIVLSVVLVALVVAAVMLTMTAQKERARMREGIKEISEQRSKGMTIPARTRYTNSLAVATNPPTLDLGNPHLLFNPVLWKARPDGRLLANKDGATIGVGAVAVRAIRPLKFQIKYTGKVRVLGDRASYQFEIVQEASLDKFGRPERPRTRYISEGRSLGEYTYADTNATYTLTGIVGSAEMPEQFLIGIGEEGAAERITITPSEPFTEVRGHVVDLYYPPEEKAFEKQRIGDRIAVDGELYNVIAISENQVVLEAQRNQKRTVISLNPDAVDEP